MMFPFFPLSVFSKKKTSHLFHHLHQSLWCDIKWFIHPNPRTLQPQQWLAKITMAASMPIVCVSKAAIFSVKSFSRNFHQIIILFSFFPPKGTTTTDEESEKTHKRAHSEGSRIGHRRTPSMEGVIQLQNGGYLRKNPSNRTTRLNQSSDLPPRIPHQSSSGHHNKKRHSHRKMKMIDINDEIEKCILFGKETTLWN